MPVNREELINYIDQRLIPAKFRDYAPNGLQVEGTDEIRRIMTGVTASQALLDEAVAWGADAVLVHHGYFWKGEDPCIKGMKQRRLKTLLTHDINLIAYHLPLDAHPELGNNVRLAHKLGLEVTGGLEPDNPDSMGLVGCFDVPLTLTQLAERIDMALGREPLVISGGNHQIQRIGLCTGGAQGYIDRAIVLGLDAYISGEISEPTVHSARENAIHYIAAGHHATERYGVQALGQEIAEQFGVEHRFVDEDNPV
ncbi:MAG: Nif3-like dinuclear metal center hexameric protein [Pontibacterium sp.]